MENCADLLVYKLRHSRRRNVRQDLFLFPLISPFSVEYFHHMERRARFKMDETRQENEPSLGLKKRM